VTDTAPLRVPNCNRGMPSGGRVAQRRSRCRSEDAEWRRAVLVCVCALTQLSRTDNVASAKLGRRLPLRVTLIPRVNATATASISGDPPRIGSQPIRHHPAGSVRLFV
jgi:hypothetical protein